MAISATAIAIKLASVIVTTDKGKFVQFIIYPVIGIMLLLFLVLGWLVSPPTADDIYSKAATELTESTEIRGTPPISGIRALHILHQGEATSTNVVKQFIQKYFIKDEVEEVGADTDDEDDDGAVHYKRFLTANECMERIKLEPFSFDEGSFSVIKLAFQQSSGADGAPLPTLPIPLGVLQSPCDGYYTSRWGYRYHPITNAYELHTGLDVGGEWHRPIYSVASGTVVTVNLRPSGYGNYVQIKHDIGGVTFYSFYAHLSRVDVRPMQTVSAGQTIGLEGGDQQHDPNPGTTSGHHLHLEFRTTINRNSNFDPQPYLPSR